MLRRMTTVFHVAQEQELQRGMQAARRLLDREHFTLSVERLFCRFSVAFFKILRYNINICNYLRFYGYDILFQNFFQYRQS